MNETTSKGFILPDILGDEDLWGQNTNQNWEVLDALITSLQATDALKVAKAGDVMTGLLLLSGPPVAALGAATKAYTDAADATRLPLAGGQMSGPLLLQADPTAGLGASTKNYSDSVAALRVAKAGDTMTGPLLLWSATPSDPLEAAARQYVDSLASTTALTYVPLTQRAAANGVATLDASGKIPSTQMPAAAIGTLNYRGTWNASTNVPTIASGALVNGVVAPRGDYFIVGVGATTAPIDGITVWAPGDWVSSNGSTWERVQTSSAAYLPIAGGALLAPGTVSGIGGLTFTNSSVIQPGATLMPDLVWWKRDPAGNIAVALDTTGLQIVQRLQVLGSATIANPSFTGNLSTTGNLAASGNLSVGGTGAFGGQVSVFSLLFPNSDLEQLGSSLMPDLSRWVRGSDGNLIFAFGVRGETIVNNLQVMGSLTAPNFSGGGGDDPNSFSASLIDARDARATANSMAVKGQSNSQIAQPIWTHNMVLIYGQSLSVGNQGLPRMSTNEGLDNLTLGLAPGGVQTTADYVFIPDTNSNINPLDGTRGYETPGISATNQWRALQLQWRDLAADPSRRLIVNGCGEGGRAIEELSKGYGPTPFYNRIPSLLNQVKAAVIAANASNTFGVCAVYYLQGEANYNPTLWDATTAGYAAKWEQLRTDITTDIKAITGQKLAPAFFASQPNSEWDNTLQQTTVGNAFIQACTTPPLGDFLCMPNYAAPNSNPNGPHMSPDGYRYMGNGAGKIMHRVFDRGEGWLPLYPVKITYRGKQFLLECHTPEPPLQTQPFYGGADGSTVQPILTDLGFSCGDSLGVLNITSIKLYNSCILINCDRTITTGAWVDYANKAHNGCGNICDSDPFLSLDVFGTLPVATLGQPYPSWNWMVAFRINAVSDV